MKPLHVSTTIIANAIFAVALPNVPALAFPDGSLSQAQIHSTPSLVTSAEAPLKPARVRPRYDRYPAEEEAEAKKRPVVIALAVLLLVIVLWEGVWICCSRRRR